MSAESTVDTPMEWARNFQPADAYWHDKARSMRALKWWHENMCYTRGIWKGKPFKLAQWQAYALSMIFGIVHRETGLRQFRKVFMGIPKKSGKTEFAAGLALMMLCYDGEASAEVYSLAANVNQASIVYNCCAEMVDANSSFDERLKIRKGVKELRDVNGLMKVMSAAVIGKQGFSPSCVVGDELHEHQSGEPWLALTAPDATMAREQALIVGLTTAGQEKEGVGWEEWKYALNVQRGVLDDPSIMPIIYAAQDEADWHDPEVWKLCNPALDSVFSMDRIEQSYREARGFPRKEAAFRQWRLCQWVGAKLQSWIQPQAWDRCPSVDAVTLDAHAQKFAGVDLGLTRDLAAAAVLNVINADPLEVAVDVRCWIARAKFEYGVDHGIEPYQDWYDQGLLHVYEEDVLPFQKFIKQLLAFLGSKNIMVGFDRWSAEFVMQIMEQHGFRVFDVRQRPQTMNAAVVEFERLVALRRIYHHHDGVLRHAIKHATLKRDDAGYVQISKKTKHKIDALTATANGLDLLIRNVKVSRQAPTARGKKPMTSGLRSRAWVR